MPLLSASHIYTPDAFLQNHVLEVDDTGTILDLRPQKPSDSPQHFSGILCPGFVNAHCHLELSVLHRQLPQGNGMVGFVSNLFKVRARYSEAEFLEAVQQAMTGLWDTGTVAVGDICNTAISTQAKRDFQQLYTYSFLELLGVESSKADEVFQKGKEFAKQFDGLPHSITAHAPYSMSEEILKHIHQAEPELLSIHLLESKEERELFETESGPFIGFYEMLGISYGGFPTTGPIAHTLKDAKPDQAMILVHLTEITPTELKSLAESYSQAYFCLCPRSNIYIHNTFPHIPDFVQYADRVCLGTDSLASNHSLDVFEEIQAIHQKYPKVSLHTLLQWATTNGAAALNQTGNLGAFEKGSRPGVNWISDVENKHLTLRTKVEKLF